MIGSQKQSIEDALVEVLAENPYCDGVRLVELVKEKVKKSRISSKEISSKTEHNHSKKEVTKQAVYFALKNLLTNEVVSKIGGKYFLSRVWINKLSKLFQNNETVSNDAIFKLEEGESISYHFPNLLTCDTYWAHIFDLLIDWIPKQKPIIVWMSHEWFIIGRQDVELDILKKIKWKKKYALYSILGRTALDQDFRKNYKTEMFSISTGSSVSFPANYFLHIFDEIMIEVFIDEKLAHKIEKFYNSHTKLTNENKKEFEKLITEKYKVRMKITRSNKKTSVLGKKISKDFFVPKGIEL